MVPSAKALAIFYRLSVVIMAQSAAVWLQFFNGMFQVIKGCISKTVRYMAKVTINH